MSRSSFYSCDVCLSLLPVTYSMAVQETGEHGRNEPAAIYQETSFN